MPATGPTDLSRSLPPHHLAQSGRASVQVMAADRSSRLGADADRAALATPPPRGRWLRVARKPTTTATRARPHARRQTPPAAARETPATAAWPPPQRLVRASINALCSLIGAYAPDRSGLRRRRDGASPPTVGAAPQTPRAPAESAPGRGAWRPCWRCTWRRCRAGPVVCQVGPQLERDRVVDLDRGTTAALDAADGLLQRAPWARSWRHVLPVCAVVVRAAPVAARPRPTTRRQRVERCAAAGAGPHHDARPFAWVQYPPRQPKRCFTQRQEVRPSALDRPSSAGTCGKDAQEEDVSAAGVDTPPPQRPGRSRRLSSAPRTRFVYERQALGTWHESGREVVDVVDPDAESADGGAAAEREEGSAARWS